MKKTFIIIFVSVSLSINFTHKIYAQVVNDLNDVAVWSFNGRITEEWRADSAMYVNPQYCKRVWFKYSEIPCNYFADSTYNLWTIPPYLNSLGSLFEGGVQCAHIQQNTGWPCDNIYDDDHLPPYEVPDPVFYDFATRNADDSIYWLGNYVYPKSNASIANENWQDFLLYWAYEQIDANVNALEFDQINAGYRFTTTGTPGNNNNDGYDDYAMGTANFATKISVVCGHGIINPIEWFMPTDSASSNNDSAFFAFDDNFETYWHSSFAGSHWIEIDFGRIRTIQQLYLKFPSVHIPNNFEITYWNGNIWQNFSPNISFTGNTDSICSFLIEPAQATKVRLSSTDNEIWISEIQLFGQGFRQYLLKKYCDSLGLSVNDSLWETEKLVVLSDTSVCPDATMNTFNYRKYMQAHSWSGNPFGTNITSSNYLNPVNPLFWDWCPTGYINELLLPFFADTNIFDTIVMLHLSSYSYQRIYPNFWFPAMDSVRTYAANLEKDIYVTRNGFFQPSNEDYLLFPLGAHPIFPVYNAPSLTDSNKVLLDGFQARINIWRMLKEYAVNSMGQDVPLVAFCDFGDHLPFAHLGGIDEPADEREIYLRIYPVEMRVAGVNFCFPVIANEEIAWLDSTSNGTALIDVINQQADFLNIYNHIYNDVTISDNETLVTVNGIVPFNGEWNYTFSGINTPVNTSKVTIAYMNNDSSDFSYLHIINHNWDSINHQMLPQSDIPVQIPAQNICEQISIVSPDFADTLSVSFVYEDSIITLTIPELEYYNVIILDWDTTVLYKQTIYLPKGWSGLSSYVNPENDSLESIFEQIIDQLIILQTMENNYWPEQNINTIGLWDTHQGYKIKVTENIELNISGTRENNNTVQLSEGWNLIPVLSEHPANVEEIFSSTDLVIVKEVAGWNIYWPGMSINTLEYLLPGKAYFVLMNSGTTIGFHTK